MKARAIVESNSLSLNEQAGFQPLWLYVGVGGSLVFTPKTDPENDVTTQVENGSWMPAEDILYVKTGSTVLQLVAYGSNA